MGPTPERTLTLCTHGAAGCFDPVAHAWVSWRPVRKFIGTTGRGLCLFSSFNEEGDGLSGAQISPKKHKERKLLLLPDVALSPVTPKESKWERERESEREGFCIHEGELAVGRRISVFFLCSSVWPDVGAGQLSLGEPRGEQPPKHSGESWGLWDGACRHVFLFFYTGVGVWVLDGLGYQSS